MKNSINIAILGLGNIGTEFVNALNLQTNSIENSFGYKINIKKILISNKAKKRTANIDANIITTDPHEIFEDESINVVVELMGGTDPSFSYVIQAIKSNKSIITANKDLIASHGKEIFELAKANKLPDRVISIIKSHHGQTLAGHFYTLAKEQAEAVGATPPNDKDFRYPGPKPKAIEEVIVSLADAVEAISRSLRDLPSEDLVKILKEEIKARESEGHFSESEITTAQFSVLKKAVLDEAVLRHHRRIGYIKES